MTNGLGRLYRPDARDALYPMRALLTGTSPRTFRHWWAQGWWGDQGETPQCVAYAWTHWLVDGPVTTANPLLTPAALYRQAQQEDEWPGDSYDGTSVRAGAKVLQDLGVIREYRWAATAADVVDTLLERGPVVFGSDWYDGMFTPDSKGFIWMTGRVRGGHAYVLDGVNVKTGVVTIKNSWGRSWGQRGFARMTIDTMAYLLERDGEACIAVENPG